MDILRDAIWSFVGVVAAVLALLLAYVTFRKQFAKKSLVYILLNQSPAFVLTDHGNANRIKVLFDGQEMTAPKTLDILFINDGPIPISVDDFAVPLSIVFPAGVSIFNAQLGEIHPADLPVAFTYSDNKLVVEPLLLNSNDRFGLRLLYEAQSEDAVTVNARINGITKIKRLDVAEDGRGTGETMNITLAGIFGFSAGGLAAAFLMIKVFSDSALVMRLQCLARTVLAALFRGGQPPACF